MNPYLKKLREKYSALRSSVEGVHLRAANEDRDLTDAEETALAGQTEQLRALGAQIEALASEEERHAATSKLMGNLREGAPANDGGHGGVNLGTEVNPRDPGHYRSAEEGGANSFYGDMLRAKLLQDAGAESRLGEHNAFMRAQTTTTLAGVVPPKWLADQFTTLAQQDAALFDAVQHYTITDARPFDLPGQTVSTVVGAQSAQNDAVTDGNSYDAASSTITPTTIVGKEIVSRQVLDASNPAVDQLILADLTASYVADRELRIGVAIRAVGSALNVSYGDFSDRTAPGYAYDLGIDAGMAVRKALKKRPTFLGMDYEFFAAILKLKDADGRPLVVDVPYGAMNAAGQASLMVDGTFAKMPIVVSEGMNPTADAADMGAAAVHGGSVVVFESPQMSFRYEEKSGPQSIELGLWRYFAVAVRQGTKAVKNILIDDDTADV